MFGRLLIAATTLLAVLLAGAIGFGLVSSGGAQPLSVALDELEDREVIHLVEEHIILVYNDGEPLALSDDAQHVGDTVVFCKSSRLFESPAHGEKFDIRGYHFGGPASRGLARYPVRLEGDLVVVDNTEEIEGPPRGAGPPLEPAGDFCL